MDELRDQKKSAIRLLGYSFLILFFELAMIRFIPAHVQVVSYFLNLVLVAAVLGMGLGLLLQSRAKDITSLFFPLPIKQPMLSYSLLALSPPIEKIDFYLLMEFLYEYSW